MKVFTVEQMAVTEAVADSQGQSYDQLMELAGKGTAHAIMARFAVSSLPILILVGKGNNGGDGLVAGRYLAEAGADVTIYLYSPRSDINYQLLLPMDVQIVHREQDNGFTRLGELITSCAVLIDSLLGTGITRPIAGNLATMLKYVSNVIRPKNNPEFRTQLTDITMMTPANKAPFVVAVDGPSGLNCTTGALDPLALPADLTVTFAGPRYGHFIFPGAAACGDLEIADIGIDPAITAHLTINVATPAMMRQLLPTRPLDGHKGTFGSVLIAGGSADYLGAPVLSARGALRAGSGVVALAIPQTVRPIAAVQLPEATYPQMPDADYLGRGSADTLRSLLSKYKAMLIGPGLGRQSGVFLSRLLGTPELPPLVVDADGLNELANRPNWWQQLPANTILTPHPGEMNRLAGEELRDQDRVAVAQQFAQKWGHIIVLKGAYTVVAAPNGTATIIPVATPVLAVGGSGDVLAGIITSLVGQGMTMYNAAVLGAYLHAMSGKLLANRSNHSGILARQIADNLSQVRYNLSRL